MDLKPPTRLIYPTLAQRLTPADLHRLFSPNYEECKWVPTIARTPSSQVALLVQLKIFQAVGRFLPVEQIPEAAIEHIARALGVNEEIRLLYTEHALPASQFDPETCTSPRGVQPLGSLPAVP